MQCCLWCAFTTCAVLVLTLPRCCWLVGCNTQYVARAASFAWHSCHHCAASLWCGRLHEGTVCLALSCLTAVHQLNLAVAVAVTVSVAVSVAVCCCCCGCWWRVSDLAILGLLSVGHLGLCFLETLGAKEWYSTYTPHAATSSCATDTDVAYPSVTAYTASLQFKWGDVINAPEVRP